jgi:predicted negative regulator of RcsB-dependent stress response
MDAQTRHQLKQNELAEALDKMRDWDNPTTRYTLVGVLAIVVIFGGWNLWSWSREQSLAQDWQRFGQIQNDLNSAEVTTADSAINDLRSLISDTGQPALEAAARLRLGRVLVDQAFVEPEQREAKLNEAIEVLEAVRSAGSTPPSIGSPARFLLATAYESAGKFDQASGIYEELKGEARFTGSPYVRLAERRLEDIDEVSRPVAMAAGTNPNATGNQRSVGDMFDSQMGPQMPNPTMPPSGQVPQQRQLSQEEINELMKRFQEQQNQGGTGLPPMPQRPDATPPENNTGTEEPATAEPEAQPETPAQPDEPAEPANQEPPSNEPSEPEPGTETP